MSRTAAGRSSRWYREPLVWLLIGIPLSSVLMGGVMLWLAVDSFDGLVADDYYRRGLEINRVLARDQAAGRFGIAGELRLDATRTRLTLSASGAGFVMPAEVALSLSYATRAGLDRAIVLSPVARGGFEGEPLRLRAGRWYVQAAAGSWRITGMLNVPGSVRAELRPVAGPES